MASSALLALGIVHFRAPAPHEAVVYAPRAAGIYGSLTPPDIAVGPPPEAFARLAAPAAWSEDLATAPAQPPARLREAPSPFGALSDPRLQAGPSGLEPALRLASRESEIPLPPLPPGLAAAQRIAVAPLPPRRPADLGATPARRSASVESQRTEIARAQAPRAEAPDTRSIFEKLFGAPRPQSSAVAYANPEAPPPPRSAFFDPLRGALSRYDKYTAVYDIEAHTVYLPGGAKLEAHSGLGSYIDDPGHVSLRAKGATPPDVYELKLREKPFYGIQALRLTPIGSGDQYGRSGLLAHPYMLGPNGDSFGCVSFKDYDAFLQAFQTGEIKRLAVVAKLQ